MRHIPLVLAALAFGLPASAHGLHPEDMRDCVAQEVATILDALAGTEGAAQLDPVAVAGAYGESFANCTRVPEVTIWQQCFARPDALDCLTGMADVAAAQIPLERAAGALLASEHGQGDAMDSWPASEAAIATHAQGIGGAARQNCAAEPPAGIAPDLNAQACRILFELGQYATWRGGDLLWSGLAELQDRSAPALSLSVSQACLRDNLSDAQAEFASVDGSPALAAGRAALSFVGCSNAAELLPACGTDARGLEACVQNLWRVSRAEGIAQALVADATLSQDVGGGVVVIDAMQDVMMSRCLEGANIQRLPPGTGWAYCATSVSGMQVAMYQGLALLEAEAP